LVGRDSARLREAAAVIGGGDGTACVDVRDEEAVAEWAVGLGEIDHVVIAVGELFLCDVVSVDIGRAREAFDSKFWSAVRVAKHLGPLVRAGGSLLFMAGGGSPPSGRPPQMWAFTAAANAGIVSLAQALALELAPVRVNVISPGLIVVPGEAAGKEAAYVLPAGRAGTAEDVAEVCVALLVNPFVTGVCLPVDGGSHLV
jgi:NAD(P)-dependent dehydrogenase (short-subunit alcohol dehydrogenase family)